MMRLLSKKLTYMEGGCMFDNLIYYSAWVLIIWYGIALGRELLTLFMTWIEFKREQWLK